MPGPSARAAVKGGGLRAEGLGQLLHAELTPRHVAGPPGRRGDLSHQVATGNRPRGAARGPGRIGDRRDRAGGRYVTRRGPGTGFEQRRQVLRRTRGPRREGPRSRLGRGKTLIEVLGCSLCRGGAGGGEGTGRSGSGIAAPTLEVGGQLLRELIGCLGDVLSSDWPSRLPLRARRLDPWIPGELAPATCTSPVALRAAALRVANLL